MQHKIEAAKMTVGLIIGSSVSMLSASGSAIALTEQLNAPHKFLYLNLPMWMFFSAIFALSIIGSVASLFTDIYKDNGFKTLPISHQILHFIGGFLSGIIGAFVLLPAFTQTQSPPLEIMMVTALALSSSGVVLLNNWGELKRDEKLQQSVRQLIISRITWFVDIFTNNKGGDK
ncbi:hypothetical protein [Psychrobacter sp.]|uniref:hypothetical protein n=1 Tax=Psychrobacter sp. TaxID=56811 RepID=UPI0025D2F09E|nr:hypothetical protein [Psychrobacter sp.]